MAKPSRRKKHHLKKSIIKKEPQWHLLEKFSFSNKRQWERMKDKFLEFHWHFYFDLAYQRSRISDKIRSSLLEASRKPFIFKNWQRVLKYRYSLEPLSTAGSLIDPGGRFNIGDIDLYQFGCFPAIYISSNKNTALQESLCQEITDISRAFDFALADHTSMTNVSLSGKLNSIIDLTELARLQPFINLIKDFKVSGKLKQMAREIGQPEIHLVQDIETLLNALLAPNWREWPMQFDVPASSQIFGQLVVNAGIEGILYPSKFDSKECLAIFPQNFDSSLDSFIELDDKPPKHAKLFRLDALTKRSTGC